MPKDPGGNDVDVKPIIADDCCGTCRKKRLYGEIKVIKCSDCGSNVCQHRIDRSGICYTCVSRNALNKDSYKR